MFDGKREPVSAELKEYDVTNSQSERVSAYQFSCPATFFKIPSDDSPHPLIDNDFRKSGEYAEYSESDEEQEDDTMQAVTTMSVLVCIAAQQRYLDRGDVQPRRHPQFSHTITI